VAPLGLPTLFGRYPAVDLRQARSRLLYEHAPGEAQQLQMGWLFAHSPRLRRLANKIERTL
jgi:hypothetical protein